MKHSSSWLLCHSIISETRLQFEGAIAMSNFSHGGIDKSRFVYRCEYCGGGVRSLLISDEPGLHEYLFVCSFCAAEFPPSWQEPHWGSREHPPDLPLSRWDHTTHEVGEFDENQARWAAIQKTFDDGAWETALYGACDLQERIVRTGDPKSIKYLLPLIGALQVRALKFLFKELGQAKRHLAQHRALLNNARIRDVALRQER